jgi:hypothetical protein
MVRWPHGDCALIQAATQRLTSTPATFHAPGLNTFTQNGQAVTFNCTITGHLTGIGSGAPFYLCVSQQDPLDWFQFSFT